MPASVYIESSIISYLTSRPSRDVVRAGRQAITSDWWIKSRSQYEVFISALVEEEISGGDPMAAAKRLEAVAEIPSIIVTSEAQSLADALMAARAVPDNSIRDALHIAIAATQGIEYLLTWNFRHINNAETKALIARVVEADGWVCPVLCSPEELGGNADEE
ncbi:type II toxin-antitoxin system VapC family toxin [uncultured Thiodictyon sp.]|jgi:predicted nucleic acid-binding protein|uniref:type II toxin-antitoxin system VapC family toxin n=1 Tax=uncultured Thiodictyon sp. TaxID=1846217 RepID=UPI0025DDBD0C|nr:type II toxin-antitoxin system VapC family toxin [uncultured Thiodictyon sp.]